MEGNGELPRDIKLRSSKHLTNLVEQDHRCVKPRIGPCSGSGGSGSPRPVQRKIELLLRIRERQFNLSRPHVRDRAVRAVWKAVVEAKYNSQRQKSSSSTGWRTGNMSRILRPGIGQRPVEEIDRV
jgi:hypothetical protein